MSSSKSSVLVPMFRSSLYVAVEQFLDDMRRGSHDGIFIVHPDNRAYFLLPFRDSNDLALYSQFGCGRDDSGYPPYDVSKVEKILKKHGVGVQELVKGLQSRSRVVEAEEDDVPSSNVMLFSSLVSSIVLFSSKVVEFEQFYRGKFSGPRSVVSPSGTLLKFWEETYKTPYVNSLPVHMRSHWVYPYRRLRARNRARTAFVLNSDNSLELGRHGNRYLPMDVVRNILSFL